MHEDDALAALCIRIRNSGGRGVSQRIGREMAGIELGTEAHHQCVSFRRPSFRSYEHEFTPGCELLQLN
jgi:hypothetical protein